MIAPKGHVYISVLDYLGIDMPGKIAIPVSELSYEELAVADFLNNEEKENAKDGE